MRSLLILTLSVLFVSNAEAQDYVFPTDSATWHNHTIFYDGSGTGKISSQYVRHYKIKGSTINNNIEYFHVYSYTDTSETAAFDYHIEGEKVYLDSTLMYDFGMEVGDTFDADNGGSFVVTKIDSIELHDGKHKRLVFNNGLAEFIRGIGSIQGLFAFMGPNVSDWSDDLMCFSHKGTTIYPRYSDSNCFQLTNFVSVTALETKPLKIYPNPVSNQITLPSDMPFKHILITDILGHSIEMHPDNNQLNVSQLLPGIYYVESVVNGVIYRSRFVKI